MKTRLRIPTLDVLGGTLGITLCPGRQIYGLTGTTPRDLDRDLDVVEEHGFRQVGVLLEDHELASLAPGLLEAYAARGIAVHRFPIVDRQAPKDLEAYRAYVASLANHLRQGERVLVHCKGGLGRAGTTAACLLVLDGHGAVDAIHAVRAVRPGAIENPPQERFVVSFEATRPA